VDRAVDVVYESIVDQPLKTNRYAILSVRHRSHGPGHVQVGHGGGHVGTERRRWRAAALHRRKPEKGFPAAKTSTGECYA
jgi:hypothetical protein